MSAWQVIANGLDHPAAFDADEARRALALLIDPDAAHELRGLPSGRSRLVRGDRLDLAVRSVAELATDRGVYVTLNPVRSDLGDHGAKNADAVHRKHLLIDVDPVKRDGDGKPLGKGETDRSATFTERAATRAVAEAVRMDLTARGWPLPLSIDSGNGWHLVYRIDLPNDALARQWVAGALKALAHLHDTPDARIDRSVHNAARISKLPGTWARKGPDTADRPHRIARIESVPSAFTPVPAELIRDLAGLAGPGPAGMPDAAPTPAADPWKTTAGGEASAYARSAMEREVGKVATATAPGRNNQLYESALKLAGYAAAGHLDPAEVHRQLANAARACGLDEAESARAIRNASEVGATTPKSPPAAKPPAKPSRNGKAAVAVAADHAEAPERLTVRASEITPKVVRWLWRDRIPVGFITVFAGRTGVGKSFVLCDLAARVTTGEDLPDGESDGEMGEVLFISEDPYEYMLAPRLIELGADLTRVRFLTWEAMLSYSLDDTGFLERACLEGDSPPRLICIDPPTNFLGDKDEHKNTEVRATLMKLVAWLNGRDTACVLITHVNKSGKGVEALNRVIGSVAWVTTARIAHSFSSDPDDASRCLFVPMKNNLGRLAKGLGYRIAGTDTLAKVEWLGEVDTTADAALGGEKRKPRAVAAGEWLAERFREKREWPARGLIAASEAAGISKNALVEARKQAPVRWFRMLDDQGEDCIVWRITNPLWPGENNNGNGGNGGNGETQPF